MSSPKTSLLLRSHLYIDCRKVQVCSFYVLCTMIQDSPLLLVEVMVVWNIQALQKFIMSSTFRKCPMIYRGLYTCMFATRCCVALTCGALCSLCAVFLLILLYPDIRERAWIEAISYSAKLHHTCVGATYISPSGEWAGSFG